jgi:EmrB/QacA subfamily drug resistance transporter
MTEGRFEITDEVHVPTLAEDPALGLPHRAKMEILFAVMLGLFLGALDQTIVGTALPKIVTQLAGNDLYTWVVTIYLLTSTITVPFWGKLSDLYGRKPMFMIGIGIFLFGSALAGLSQNMGMLILFRGIQGIGAGSLFPIAIAIIGDLFTPAERGKYQGLFGAVFGVSALVGPAIGGILTDVLSWHWIFYVNIPVGIASLYFIWRLLPTVKRTNASRNFDFLGAGIFAVAIGFLLVGLTNKQTGDWTDTTVGGFILVALVGIVLFILAEIRAKEPIVPLRLFRLRTYSSSMIATFAASFGFFGAIIFLPRWFQFVEGFSATGSGYATIPLLVGLIGSSIASGLIVSRTGRYKWLTVGSIAIMAVGLALMTQLRADTPLPVLWFWMFVTGVGVGPTMATFTIIVQNAVPFEMLGVATANLTFFRQIGGSVALAVAGTVFGTTLKAQLFPQMAAAGVPQPVVDGFKQASGGGGLDFNQLAGVGVNVGQAILNLVPPQYQDTVRPLIPNIVDGIHRAFSLGVAQTFFIGVGAAVVAGLAAAAMHEHPLRKSFGPHKAHAPEPVGGASIQQGAPAAEIARVRVDAAD